MIRIKENSVAHAKSRPFKKRMAKQCFRYAAKIFAHSWIACKPIFFLTPEICPIFLKSRIVTFRYKETSLVVFISFLKKKNGPAPADAV